VADLSEGICDSRECPTITNGRIVFRDRDHLTASFAATFEPALDRLLDPYLR